MYKPEVWIPAALSSLWLMAAYPMTQIYQHEEDARRGDLTLSRLLGIQGTFIFTATAFLLVNAGFFLYFRYYVRSGICRAPALTKRKAVAVKNKRPLDT